MVKEFSSKDIENTINTIISFFKENETKINNLNVFPVPDGDTGTNMLLTLKSIQSELLKEKKYNLKNIADKISYGALMGARGNSGVILSQILKGFFDEISQKQDINYSAIESAVKSSAEVAYNSVQNPTEGTILTTIKDIYNTVKEVNGDSISYSQLLNLIIKEAEKSVLRTTYLLPVLKKANVVDAGAQGLLDILIGFKKAIANSDNFKLDNEIKLSKNTKMNKKDEDKVKSKDAVDIDNDKKDDELNQKKLSLISDIKYIYCTELIVKGKNIGVPRLKEEIERLGDSALIVGDKNLAKVHVHTNYPNKVLNRCLKEGTLHDIQINNMIDQTRKAAESSTEILDEVSAEKKNQGFITIANGEGFEQIFKSLGVDIVIKGGQSMNPSTYEIVKAIDKIDCKDVAILPNNKNIVLTANQAKRISKKNIEVIPTNTIPQGISAMLGFNPDMEFKENIGNMKKEMGNVKTGEVTTAVRDANLHVGRIKKGEYIGLSDGNVRVISDNIISAVLDLIRDMVDSKTEIITLYFGKEVTPDINKRLKAEITKYFPDIEVEFHNGGQPLYQYIFSIE